MSLSCHFFARVELSEAKSTAEHEESVCRDAAIVLDVRNTLGSPTLVQGPKGQHNNTTSSILTVAQRNISQLVAVRLAHQTKRAAKSVKTHSDPQDSTAKVIGQTDRQRLHAQMVEVVRRAGTGLERGARWRSGTAPGTQGPDEVLLLTGNSANAELAAKERVSTVCDSSFLGKSWTFSKIICRLEHHERNTSIKAISTCHNISLMALLVMGRAQQPRVVSY